MRTRFPRARAPRAPRSRGHTHPPHLSCVRLCPTVDCLREQFSLRFVLVKPNILQLGIFAQTSCVY